MRGDVLVWGHRRMGEGEGGQKGSISLEWVWVLFSTFSKCLYITNILLCKVSRSTFGQTLRRAYPSLLHWICAVFGGHSSLVPRRNWLARSLWAAAILLACSRLWDVGEKNKAPKSERSETEAGDWRRAQSLVHPPQSPLLLRSVFSSFSSSEIPGPAPVKYTSRTSTYARLKSFSVSLVGSCFLYTILKLFLLYNISLSIYIYLHAFLSPSPGHSRAA